MKLPALLLAGSLAANAVLVAVYINDTSTPTEPTTKGAGSPPAPEAPPRAASPTSATTRDSATAPGTAAADPKTWAHLYTADLRTLSARLRAAGFPPATIRTIIAAQVADQLRPRAKELADGLEVKPFWETNRGFGYDPKFSLTMRELGRESDRLIKEALGPDFPADDSELSEFQRRQYGNLPKEKVDQLKRVADDYNEMRVQTMNAARGLMLPEDREKLAILEKERRADLAQLLSPQEMEDYLMRTSLTTSQLRGALTTMNASEGEFRAIFQAKQAYEDKYGFQSTGGGMMGPDQIKERTAAQKQVTEQIKAALGEQRYVEYARAADGEFQSITRLVQQANLPGSAAVQAYDLRANASKESYRIFADAALSNEQKRAALQTLAQTTRSQLTAALGADAGGSYLKVAAPWLSSIERGGAVTFNENGGSTTYNLSTQRPTGAASPGSPAPAVPVTTKTGG